MNLAYVIRLACLSLAAFFLIHALLGLAISAIAPWVVRFVTRLAPRKATRLLLSLRLIPAALAIFLVAAVFTPSYLVLEPKAESEPIGFACLAAAALGIAVWAQSIARAAHAWTRSRRHVRDCRLASREVRLAGERLSAWVIEQSTPCVMLTGLLQPRLVISRNVLSALSAEQLSAVIRHERAHAASHDNLKRLLLLLTPDVLPFVPVFRRLERAWARLAEWAADDRAVAGKSRRSLSLASALVRVARLGAVPVVPVLTTSLLAGGADLSERVDRLLRSTPRMIRQNPPEPVLAAAGSILVAGAVAAVIAQPVMLHSAHEFLEFLIQ